MLVKKIILILIMSIVHPGARCQDLSKQYALKYSIKPGSSFTVDNRSIITDRKIVADEEKLFIYTTTNMILGVNILENDVANGNVVEMEYLEKSFINYWDDGRVENRDHQKIIHSKIQFTLSEYGEISDFKGFEKFRESEDEANQIAEMLQEELIHLFPHLPNHPVKIGDKWTGGVESDGENEGFSLEYNLLGEEVIDGIECLKITANYVTQSEFPYHGLSRLLTDRINSGISCTLKN